jgi:hypothetical protein
MTDLSKLTLLQIKVDDETMTVLAELKSLLSHQVPDGNLQDILKIMAEISLEQIKKRKGINDKINNSKIYKDNKTEMTLTQMYKSNIKSKLQLKNNPNPKSNPTIKCNVNTEEEGSPNLAKHCIKQSRYISREVRRAVFKRAEGQCEYIHNGNGERCQSRHQLEFDHVQAFSQGGSNGMQNITLSCKTHNLYRTKETHGFWYQTK